ncbi:MAG: DUF559 domain-containing protein, partial [Anaerolineae bacterium]
MARKRKARIQKQVGDYRHDEARRKNNPPAGIAPTYEVRERRVTSYAYDPHLDPQLQWGGKAEHTSFDVDVVSLHIHERISTRAILDAVRRPEPLQLSLFGETPLPLNQQIEFYQHEVGWVNRLILGDSLLMMNSLLVKEGMAGKMQMIYVDPPYGIKYSSNFQPRIDRRDVKDKDEDLTHEPEQIKAYRDTWRLGIHSWLTYLRDRLLLARELLTESGSIFVQINDENLHLVRNLLDEVFGRENFIAVVAFRKTGGFPSGFLASVYDYLLWYTKDRGETKYRQLHLLKTEAGTAEQYRHTDEDGRSFEPTSLFSDGATPSGSFIVTYRERTFHAPANCHWKTSSEGIERLKHAGRLWYSRNRLRYVRYLDDFPVIPLTNVWDDTMGEREMLYAVQTNTKVVERCILMTTDPGDLVFDPTCVRKGTKVWAVEAPPVVPPQAGGREINPPRDGGGRGGANARPVSGVGRGGGNSRPVYGEGRGGGNSRPVYNEGRGGGNSRPVYNEDRGGGALIPIESLRPGDWVLAHDGRPHRVLRTIQRPYKGLMIGIQTAHSDATLWLTADHRVLVKPRPRSLGGHADWSATPLSHLERRKQLRREMTPPERKLWQALRRQALGVKFRRQHPIGPYIADFYSREAQLVVEVDGATAHDTPEAQAHDEARDAFMRSLGLRVLRVPAREVQRNLPGVVEAIRAACEEQFSPEGAEWIEAGDLRAGDIVFVGVDLEGVPIVSIQTKMGEEEVYDLEVEDVHSFVTEVCAVHNCGSGTT